jgi:hypothetical protein
LKEIIVKFKSARLYKIEKNQIIAKNIESNSSTCLQLEASFPKQRKCFINKPLKQEPIVLLYALVKRQRSGELSSLTALGFPLG